jgi:hypothetical protein
VIDETPAAYKDIDAVMAAQADLVEIVHTLRQVVCVKGWESVIFARHACRRRKRHQIETKPRFCL